MALTHSFSVSWIQMQMMAKDQVSSEEGSAGEGSPSKFMWLLLEVKTLCLLRWLHWWTIPNLKIINNNQSETLHKNVNNSISREEITSWCILLVGLYWYYNKSKTFQGRIIKINMFYKWRTKVFNKLLAIQISKWKKNYTPSPRVFVSGMQIWFNLQNN